MIAKIKKADSSVNLIKMKQLLLKFFGTSRPVKQLEDLEIETNIPLTVKGVPFKDVLKMDMYLKNLKVNQSFPIDPKLAYTARKIARKNYPEINITIRNTGKFFRVYRLA